MEIIIKHRQEGKTTELLRMCEADVKNGLKPLLIVPNLNMEWVTREYSRELLGKEVTDKIYIWRIENILSDRMNKFNMFDKIYFDELEMCLSRLVMNEVSAVTINAERIGE